jgi:threonine/homoserine/homoserine lactone efflux protein
VITALGEVLPLAIGIAVSPFPVIPAILMLFTRRAGATSAGFLVGWVIGIGVVAAGFTALATLIESRDYPPTWASWLRILVGVTLAVLGVRQWLTRARRNDPPAWMQSIEDSTPLGAVRLGVLLSAANPKILLLAAAAGLAIGSEDLGAAAASAAIVLFTAISSSTVAAPVVLYALRGDRILGPMSSMRDWLQANNASVMAVVITVVGLALIIKGMGGL